MRFSAMLAALALTTGAASVFAQDVPPQDHPDQHKAKPAAHPAKKAVPPKHKQPAPKKHHTEPKDKQPDDGAPRHE